jgi:hypothetical protein
MYDPNTRKFVDLPMTPQMKEAKAGKGIGILEHDGQVYQTKTVDGKMVVTPIEGVPAKIKMPPPQAWQYHEREVILEDGSKVVRARAFNPITREAVALPELAGDAAPLPKLDQKIYGYVKDEKGNERQFMEIWGADPSVPGVAKSKMRFVASPGATIEGFPKDPKDRVDKLEIGRGEGDDAVIDYWYINRDTGEVVYKILNAQTYKVGAEQPYIVMGQPAASAPGETMTIGGPSSGPVTVGGAAAPAPAAAAAPAATPTAARVPDINASDPEVDAAIMGLAAQGNISPTEAEMAAFILGIRAVKGAKK